MTSYYPYVTFPFEDRWHINITFTLEKIYSDLLVILLEIEIYPDCVCNYRLSKIQIEINFF